jgi:hypothetical protein
MTEFRQILTNTLGLAKTSSKNSLILRLNTSPTLSYIFFIDESIHALQEKFERKIVRKLFLLPYLNKIFV